MTRGKRERERVIERGLTIDLELYLCQFTPPSPVRGSKRHRENEVVSDETGKNQSECQNQSFNLLKQNSTMIERFSIKVVDKFKPLI